MANAAPGLELDDKSKPPRRKRTSTRFRAFNMEEGDAHQTIADVKRGDKLTSVDVAMAIASICASLGEKNTSSPSASPSKNNLSKTKGKA